MARIHCLVPHCRRTTDSKNGYGEWICSKHWAAVPKASRRVYSRATRRIRRAVAAGEMIKFTNGSSRLCFRKGTAWVEHIRALSAYERLWKRMKKLAVERSLGI